MADRGFPDARPDCCAVAPSRLASAIARTFAQSTSRALIATGLGLALAAASGAALGETYVVTSNDDPGDGQCNSDCTLREAIAAANARPGFDVVDAGFVTGTITLADVPAVFNFIEITDTLTLFGPGADELTIDAHGASRFFSVTEPTAAFDIHGLTLANGSTVGHGGAIYSSSNLRLFGVTIVGASSQFQGGGILVSDAYLSLIDSSILNCNATTNGGGFVVYNGDATLVRSTISGNTTNLDGGGFVVSNGNAFLTNSTVSQNTALDPSGANGGGIFVHTGDVLIEHGTIVGNVIDADSGSGGGVFLFGGTLTLRNSIVANNFRYDIVGASTNEIQVSSGSLDARYSLVEGNSSPSATGPGNITGLDPAIGPLADNGGPTPTRAIDTSSPAWNAGSNAYASGLDHDQRGAPYPRIVAGTVDMGAVEVHQATVGPNFSITNTLDPGDGICSAIACTLREAVTAANAAADASAIEFAPGVSGTLRLADVPGYNFLFVTQPLTINGPGAYQLTIDAHNASRFFSVTEPTADFTVRGLTLANGNTVGHGGAIYSSAMLHLEGVIIDSANSAHQGGALSVNGADVIIANSTITGSTATTNGGGLFLTDGSATLIRSTISDNYTPQRGGGVYVRDGNASVSYSTISGNSTNAVGSYGGGLYVLHGNASFTNATVSGNTVYGNFNFGGGFFVRDGDVLLAHSTVTDNATSDLPPQGAVGAVASTRGITGSGGGFCVEDGGVTLRNSIVANNVSGSGSAHEFRIAGFGSSLDASYSLVEGDSEPVVAGPGNLAGLDPALGPLQDMGGATLTHPLLTGSPAIDTGDPVFVPPPDYDQRGGPFLRVFNGRTDIGAMERQIVPEIIFGNGFELPQ